MEAAKLRRALGLPLVLALGMAAPLTPCFAQTQPQSQSKPAAPSEQDQKEKQDNDKYRALEALAKGIFYLQTLYVDPSKVDHDHMVMDALGGIVAKLDPHTMVMPKEAFEQITSDTQGKFGGVGIIVSTERGKLTVISPILDTPAYNAGILSGDEIVAIDDLPIAKISPTEATQKMRGKPDSKIKLTIKRKNTDTPMNFTLVREIIKVPSVKSAELGNGVMYSRITSFQDNTFSELQRDLEKHSKKAKIKGLILDLRDNPGGLLEQAVRVSDLFIESGVIVSTVGRDRKNIEREFAHKRGTLTGFPMIVLINGGSASASEIVAGALQDHQRALIMGETSFGKGSVQTLVSLPNRAGLKVTVARYYTPNDRSIQAKGIYPDIFLAANEERVGMGDDQQRAERKGKGNNGRQTRKEADLKRHIEGEDLSALGKKSGLLASIKKWPAAEQKDKQLVAAFTYIRGLSVLNTRGGQFGRKTSSSAKPQPKTSPPAKTK